MMMSLLRPGGQILAYAHRLSSPIDAGGTRLAGRRLIFTSHNLPPASVWGYEPAAEG
jgi:phospholipid N-methyltransferase